MFMSEKSRVGAGSNPALLHGTTSTDRTRIAVVIPALNEESSIGMVINAIPRPLVAEIIVVDNGSTDRTETVARDSGAIVLFESRKGYGYACLAGIHHAVNNGAEIIVFLDGDFSDYPEELPKLVRPIIEQGYDMVIGSRMIGSREKGAMLPQALFGNWLACTLIRLFWGYRFTDLGPFRAIRVDALHILDSNGAAHLASAAVFACCLMLIFFMKRSMLEKTFLIFFCFALLSPVVHPWYLTWLAALLVLRWSASVFLLLGLSNLSNLVVYWHRQTEVWEMKTWLLGLEYLPFLFLLAWELSRGSFSFARTINRNDYFTTIEDENHENSRKKRQTFWLEATNKRRNGLGRKFCKAICEQSPQGCF